MTTSIFNLPSPTSPGPKIHISHSHIPQSYLNPSQPPVRRSPYRQINDTPFLRSVQICMPKSISTTLFPHQSPPTKSFTGDTAAYAKVILSLRDILENEPLRKGNYLLLSSPEDSAVRITLRRGTLTLIMPQQIYQRSGLTFPSTKLQSGGRKHEKGSALQKLEVDLRQPGMMKGRKGFDRLMYAAKNVDGLREARTCLCVDLDQPLAEFGSMKGKKRKREDLEAVERADQSERGVSAITTVDSDIMPSTMSTSGSDLHNHILANHHPIHVTDQGTTSIFTNALVPPIFNTLSALDQSLQSHNHNPAKSSQSSILEDDMHEIIEYLSLLFLESPQLTKQAYGKTDPYISQYRLPDPSILFPQPPNGANTTTAQQQPQQECNGLEIPMGTKVQDLQLIRYEGLISSEWMVQVVVDLIRRSRAEGKGLSKDDAWVIIKAEAHRVEPVGARDGYMIVLHGAAGKDDDSGGEDDIEERTVSVVDEEEQSSSNAEQMVIDEEEATTDRGKTGTVPRQAKMPLGGFSSVTCFEFIDSFN